MKLRSKQTGFTLIELLVVVVVIGILTTLVVSTYSGIRQKTRNTHRQKDINGLQSQLEAYFAQQGKYPTAANMQNRTWIQANLKNVDLSNLQDPRWSTKLTCKDSSEHAVLANSASDIAGCYTYQVTDDSGNACNDATIDCTKYTLGATYEGGGDYKKTSLN
ncbi:MAG TPA: prepilin-type N-terminal cleavage/methylation domain-containing protein [Candidatus Saccharimonadales bacterium]|nr:prepilin-type N-terminal cleavage/methylation domain-containing protein [Candidatus Saccharimonadales bacterium]